jgi:hypothetical protein
MNRLVAQLGISAVTLAVAVGTVAVSAQAQTGHTEPAPPAADGPHGSRDADAPVWQASARTWSVRTGVGVLGLDWSDLDDTPNAGAGDYLVMQPWEYPRIRALRAANSHLRILMYKDASATVSRAHESGIYPTGVSYQEADARHPGWFLTDPAGHRLEWSDWTGLYPMNIANAGYQDAWASNVLDELRAHDWDGVMLDDTLTYLSHPTVDARVSTQIPDHASMYRATRSFLAHVGPRISNAGYMAVPNVTVEWNTWKSTLTDWSPYVSGWENEFFVKWGLDRQTRFEDADWEWKMRMAAWCAARRLPLLAITYSSRDDLPTMAYHRATWLLTWNGRTGASIFVPAEQGANHWAGRANTYLGTPTGARHRSASVWTRKFTQGMVMVNPTTQARQVDATGGYRTLAGDAVTTVRLAPRTAALLRR